MTVWLPCVGASELLRVVSSAPYSQAATGVRRDICRVAGPVRPQPATMTPAALSVSAGCCETDPTGVAIGQLPQGSVMYFSGSLSDSPRRLTELTKEGYLASRTLLETSHSSPCRAGSNPRFGRAQFMGRRDAHAHQPRADLHRRNRPEHLRN